jgi:hypothetical protein
MLSNILLIKIWHLTCKKNLQFVAILYLLTHGKLMSDFENMGFLLDLLKVKHCYIKYGVLIYGGLWLKFSIPSS